MEPLRRQYGSGLLDRIDLEIEKERQSDNLAKIDTDFMQQLLKIRPKYLTNEEIEARAEVIALRIGKLIRRISGADL